MHVKLRSILEHSISLLTFPSLVLQGLTLWPDLQPPGRELCRQGRLPGDSGALYFKRAYWLPDRACDAGSSEPLPGEWHDGERGELLGPHGHHQLGYPTGLFYCALVFNDIVIKLPCMTVKSDP